MENTKNNKGMIPRSNQLRMRNWGCLILDKKNTKILDKNMINFGFKKNGKDKHEK